MDQTPSARTGMNRLAHAAARVGALAAVLSVVGAGAMAQTALPPPGLEKKPGTSPNAIVGSTPSVPLKPLKKGTEMVYRTVGPNGDSSTITLRVIDDGTYNGRPVARVTNGKDTQIIDRQTRNWMAILRDGKEIASAKPHRGIWQWPLTVGKAWTAEFVYTDGGVSVGPIGMHWLVESWERVTVPAGTFKAMRLRGEPGRNNTRRVEIWYAPKPGLVVKRTEEQATEKLGVKARTETVLVNYEPK